MATAQNICHEDGTVTFQYKNDQAKEVMVDVQFAGRNAMTRDAKTGLWTVTLGPAAPDMYPYCFIVDGVSVMDPENPQYFPNEGFKNSLLEIPASKGKLAHDILDVPHGKLEYIHYYSKSLGATNQAVVYLPPKYQENKDKKYPVFYLISGTTDTEEVYYKVGRVNYILDNLLAEGKAEEMIVVLPYGNPYKLLPTPPSLGLGGMPQTMFGKDVFSLDLTDDLMPYVEQHYRTINDADHRAIGGFSRGGNQGLSNGLHNLDKFSYLCSYSSFTSTDIPGVYDHAAETNSKIHLFWLGVGTDDFLFGNARDYMEFLDKKGIRSVKEFTHDKFGHTWMNAKYFLSKTLPLLFKPEVAEQAMKNGQPAPAATGKEQQFTPGVMARLFPKPIISPEYKYDSVVFRMKAPDAKEVLLAAEILPKPKAMERDSDGIWSTEIDEHIYEAFTYYFIVDGTAVADPQNMYLAPSKGFKPSICNNPAATFNFMNMAEMEHGVVSYDLNENKACYQPAGGKPEFIIQLIPGKDDTMESWFKIGGADVMADKFIAAKKLPPFCITTGEAACCKGKKCEKKVYTLKADDYPNWPERRHALESILDSLMLQRAAKGEISLNLPLFQTKYTADPSPLVVGDTLFLFTSHDASPEDIPDVNEKSSAGFFMYDWLLWSTTDMVNWTEHGAVASLKDIPWRSRENGAWAIQTVERNGKYYLYAPLHGHGIAVLKADSPYGPFKDPLGKPLVWDQSNWFDIDPSVYTDEDGQAYLYWGNPHTFYAKLNDDMISLKSEVTKLPHIKHYQEGPWIYGRRQGDRETGSYKYYLAYASTCCPEALGYAMSDSPTGPWEWKNYIMRPTLRDRGNHPGICDFKGHSYVFGQSYDLMHLDTFTHHERRSVSATEITYNEDGTIQEVPYWLDQEPMKQLCWLNPYQRVEAETMAWGYGLKSAKMGIENTGVVAEMPTSTGKKNMYIFDINDGEFIKLRGVDFGHGAKKFNITAASTGSCKVTLRLDGQDGPIVGEAVISKTGSVEKYKAFNAKVTNASGVHDLYLCFSNTAGETRLDWWKFEN